MANLPISVLPNVLASGVTPIDLLVIVNYDVLSGTTKNITALDLQTYVTSGITDDIITGGTYSGGTLVLNTPGGPINISEFTTGTTLYEVGIGLDSTQRKYVGADASGDYSLVAGGSGNTANGACSFIGGGVQNTATCDFSFIGSGCLNKTEGIGSSIINGYLNKTIGFFSFIGNGSGNTTNCNAAFIGGGRNNTTLGERNVIGGGVCNTTNFNTSIVVGGTENKTLSCQSVITGGFCNTTTNSGYAVISGGEKNTIRGLIPNVGWSIIGAGCNNTLTSTWGGILGGCGNILTHNCSFIVGHQISSCAPNTTHVNCLIIKNLPNNPTGLCSGSLWYDSADSCTVKYVP